MGKGTYLGGGTLVRTGTSKRTKSDVRDKLNAIAKEISARAAIDAKDRATRVAEFKAAKKRGCPNGGGQGRVKNDI